MEATLKEVSKSLMKVRKDVELIKNILMSDGELSEWARRELERARKTPEVEYVSLEEVKSRVLSKK